MKKYWPILVFIVLVLVRYWGVLWSELFLSSDHIAAYGLEFWARNGGGGYCDGILGGVKVLPMFWLNPLTLIPAAWGMALASLVGCVGMWLYLKKGYAGFFGGIAYGFTGLLVSLMFAGHGGKMWVIGFFPLAMWVVDNLRNWKWGVGLGVIGWLMLSFHIQMAYYSFVFMVIYWALSRKWRSWRWVLVGIGVSALLFMPQFLLTNEIVKESTRVGKSFERACTYSMPPEEVMCVLDQSFKGELGDYSGRKEFKQHTEIMGAICIILALLGLVVWRSWALLGMGLISLMFAFGGFTPVYKLIYLLPPNGSFRSPSMAFFGFVFVVVVFASQGAKALKWMSIVCGLLLFWDLYFATMKYTQPLSFEEAYGNVGDVAEFLQKDASDFRIFTPHPEIGDNRFMLWGIKSLNGYYPFPRKAFIDSVGGGILPDFTKLTLRVAKDYGVKYVVAQNGPVGQLVFRGKYYNVYKL